jgi:hypothetical protein
MNVKVAVRCRPFSSKEEASGCQSFVSLQSTMHVCLIFNRDVAIDVASGKITVTNPKVRVSE